MWAKIDDGTPDHPKLCEAGEHLGGEDATIVAFGFWAKGLCYANKHLTDGFLPLAMVRTWSDRAVKIAAALVAARLWDKASGGFKIHDYHDHNPHADEVRTRKEQDRIRKENERRKKLGLPPPEDCPPGIQAESERNPAGHMSDTSEDCPPGIQAESERNPEPRAPAGRARGTRPHPVPSRPVPSPSDTERQPAPQQPAGGAPRAGVAWAGRPSVP